MAISAPAIVKNFFPWIAATMSQLWHLTASQLPSKSSRSSPNINLESQSPQKQPQPSSSNSAPESESPQRQPPPSPESPPGMQQVPPPTIYDPQLNNMIHPNQDLEMELPKVLLSSCFTGALQITIQYKEVAQSEFRHSINLLSLAILAIFSSLFISHFIGKKLPTASKVLEKVAFFLAATTFYFSTSIVSPLSVKCAIWAVYVISLITIAICNCL